ncbi:hypothetical protein RhiirB3_424332 [Rhizophagus irregularis]|uniref:Uncharacterized protein n=1 Tax=Rhizophagus irregularis TaxID=588596 RepID=A0A2I1DRW6_9GLOM|nr:hypothetical protein RhiirB3_424332 [Rhizophagus irregularis]PKY48607.1 hypothetical protein RhiirA4_464249 [Rhizophagus irregularis]
MSQPYGQHVRPPNYAGGQQNPESSNESIPRTREDFEELRNEGKIRTNQYGDIEIIN